MVFRRALFSARSSSPEQHFTIKSVAYYDIFLAEAMISANARSRAGGPNSIHDRELSLVEGLIINDLSVPITALSLALLFL